MNEEEEKMAHRLKSERVPLNRGSYAVLAYFALNDSGESSLSLGHIDKCIRENTDFDPDSISRFTKNRALKDLIRIDLVDEDGGDYKIDGERKMLGTGSTTRFPAPEI